MREITKDNINERMLFKLRNGYLCTMLSSNLEQTLYNVYEKEYYFSATIRINSYDNILCTKDTDSHCYDIIAIKEYPNQVEVLHRVLNNQEPKVWDWVREERSEKEVKLEQLIEKLETQLNDAKTEMNKIKNT